MAERKALHQNGQTWMLPLTFQVLPDPVAGARRHTSETSTSANPLFRLSLPFHITFLLTSPKDKPRQGSEPLFSFGILLRLNRPHSQALKQSSGLPREFAHAGAAQAVNSIATPSGDYDACNIVDTLTIIAMDQENYNNGYFGRPVVPSAATSTNITPLRPGTPNTDGSRNNPFGDDTASSHRPGASTNPFGSPDASRPASSYGSSSAIGNRFDERSQRYFHSRRVQKGDIEKPWLAKKDPKEKWVTILPLVGILIGLGISGFLIYDGLSSVVHHKYCPVMDENFDGGLNTDVWTKEVTVGGFGYALAPK